MEGDVVTVSCPLHLHHNILVESLWQLLVCQNGVDSDWHWGGRSIRVHRLVVNAFLPESLNSVLPSNAQAPLDDSDHLQLVLEFLYKGSVAVKREVLEKLLSLASDMHFQLLVDAIGDSLERNDNKKVDEEVGSCSTNRKNASQPAQRSVRRRGHRKQPPPPKTASSADDDSGGNEEEWRPTIARQNRSKSREATRAKRNCHEPSADDSQVEDDHRDEEDQSEKEGEPVVANESVVEKEGRATHPARSSKRRGTALSRVAGGASSSSNSVAKTHDCPHCSYSTTKNWCYYSHLKTAHGVNTRGEPAESKSFECEACPFVGKSKCELKYHAVAKHSVVKPFKCSQCPIAFGRKADMVKHVQVAHLGIRPHLCEMCGHRAVSKTKLNQHRRVHTGDKPYHCEQCGKSYADRTTYRRHMQTHDKDDRPFVCHECGRSFGRQDNLNTHLKKGHRTFNCRLCPYTSGIKGDVGKHLRTVHTDVKPYACDSCAFRTGNAQNLDRHKRVHTGTKPFHCTLCPMTYGDRTTYRRHVQRHLSDAKPWTCDICGHSFGVRYSLNAHMKHVHKQQRGSGGAPVAPPPPPLPQVASLEDCTDGGLSDSRTECVGPEHFHVSIC